MFKDNQTQITMFHTDGASIFDEEVFDAETFEDGTAFENDDFVLDEMPKSFRHLEEGSTFVRKYTIKKFLGQGALGIAYVAEEEGSFNQVVVKEFFPKGMVHRELDGTVAVEDETSLQKVKSYEKMKKVFEEEAQNIVTINTVPHKNVAGFVSLEQDVNNTIYYLMPYSKGEELGDYLKRLKEVEKKLSQKEIMALIEPILNGLSHIHSYGVYHKDIKPANIYIRQDGEPLLIDFGASVTSAHLLTPTYAPIEQVKRIVSEYGAYTDIYALAVMMHEMIVGSKPPKSQERAEAIARGESDPYAPLVKMSELRKNFDKHFLVGIDRALALAYTARPQTAKEFKEELRGDLKRKKRNKWIAVTLLTLAFLSALGYVVYEKQRAKYAYLIVPNNSNSQVLVDNRRVELDKENRYRILLGKHSVEIKNGQGYLTLVKELEFKDEHEQQRIENSLIKEQVLFEVRTANDLVAQVEINGEFVGNTPYVSKLFYDKANGGLEKKYAFVLKKEGYEDSKEKYFSYREFMREQSNKLNFELRKKEGFVEIKSPVGFKVKVNGALLRDANGHILLTPLKFKRVPGDYTVYLYSSKRDTIGKHKFKVYKPILRVVSVKDKETTLFPQVKAEKNPKYVKLLNIKNKELKVSKKKILKTPKKPQMGDSLQGVRFAKTEVTYDELVRFLNSASLSSKALNKYFAVHLNSVAKYIKKELVGDKFGYSVYKGYEQYPVTQISWHGAKAYIKWLNEVTNSSYRLPRQKEWQQVANVDRGSHNLSAVLAPVGSLKANSLKLFDLYGNVAEWSEDRFGEYSRLVLGGSFNTLKEYMNPKMQSNMNESSTKNSDIGFRLVQ